MNFIFYVGINECDCHTCLRQVRNDKEKGITPSAQRIYHCTSFPSLSLRGAKRRGSHIHLYPHLCIYILTNYRLPTTEYYCVYPCLRSGTENRPLYPIELYLD